jgi:hypothetical protein
LKTEKFSSALKNAVAYYTAGIVVVISEVAGLAPGYFLCSKLVGRRDCASIGLFLESLFFFIVFRAK